MVSNSPGPNSHFFPNDQDSKGNLRREHASLENLKTECFTEVAVLRLEERLLLTSGTF